MTPKQTLLAHLEEHHATWLAKLPKSKRTLDQLAEHHAHGHYRYGSSGHFHWNGDQADANRGPGQRPTGWRTGKDVRIRHRPPPPRKESHGQ